MCYSELAYCQNSGKLRRSDSRALLLRLRSISPRRFGGYVIGESILFHEFDRAILVKKKVYGSNNLEVFIEKDKKKVGK